jgi:hypothetical protein
MDVKDVPHIYKSFFVLCRVDSLWAKMKPPKYKIKFLGSVYMPEVWGGYNAEVYESMSKLLPEFLEHNNKVAKMGERAMGYAWVEVKGNGRWAPNKTYTIYTVFCCHSNDEPTKADLLGNLHCMEPTELHEFLEASAIPSTMTDDTYLIERES